MKEATAGHKVLEESIAEPVRILDVERAEVVVPPDGRASLLSRGGVGWIDVEVVVDVRPVAGATCKADAVRTGEGGHVTGVEALGGEHRYEGVDAGGGRGEVGIGCELARRSRIPASQRHYILRSAMLQGVLG